MTIEERLEKLEKELSRATRRNLWLLAVVALAFGLGVVIAQPAGTALEEVRANHFIVVDENGKTRARMGASKDFIGLFVCDEKGKARIWMGTTKDGPVLTLSDGNGIVQWYAH